MSVNKFPFYKQFDLMDCGPTCLKMISKYYGKLINIEYLRSICNLTKIGVSMASISDGAEKIGFHTLIINSNIDFLQNNVPLPCIAYWRVKHFIVIYKISSKYVFVADPAFGKIKYTINEFLNGWIPKTNKVQADSEGVIMILETTPDFYNDKNEKTESNKFKYILPFLKPHKKLFIQLFLGLILSTIIQLIFPFLTQFIVDNGIFMNNLNFINLILIGQIILIFSQIFGDIIRNWLLLHITSKIEISLLTTFLMKLMKLPIAYFDSKNIGDLLQRIQDNNRIQNFLSNQSLNILFSIINCIMWSIIIFYYNSFIFLIFVICSIITILWVLKFQNKRKIIDYKRFDEGSGNQSSTIQILNGMQEIRLNNSAKRRRWEWESYQIKLFKLTKKSLTLSNFQDVGRNLITQLMNILITYYSAKNVIDGKITLGTMLAIQFIVGQLNIPINNFIVFIQNFQDAKISFNRLEEILNKSTENDTNSDNLNFKFIDNTSIFFNNVYFRYGSKTSNLILNNISFEIMPNKITAIVGSSGSGKTTLIKLLLKIYKPTDGLIVYGSDNIEDFNSDNWRKEFGAVMQDSFLFADTIVRNITESNSDNEIDKVQLLNSVKVANIEDFIENLPHGFNTRVGSSGMNISGGQRQRLFIARIIYKNSNFIIFDEATSSLDAKNEKIIIEKLQSFFKNKTVVIVAHRLSTVKNADQILVLEKGSIVEKGNHTELVNKKGLYFELIKNQLELGN